MSINSVSISGNIATDLELKTTQMTHKSVIQFTLGAFGGRKDERGEWKSEFIPCTAWGSAADAIAKLQKGDALVVEGKLCNDYWVGKDGNKAYKTFINVTSIVLPKAPKAQQISLPTTAQYPGTAVQPTAQPAPLPPAQNEQYPPSGIFDISADDLPF